MMNVLEHGHPLRLVDLQQEYDPEADSDEDEDDDVITRDEFRCTCDRCGQQISMYHKYYYKCMGDDSSCDFSLHKFCAELPERLEHKSHAHPLTLGKGETDIWQLSRQYWICNICRRRHKPREIQYICSIRYNCDFYIDINCVVQLEKYTIHHPSHQHLLTCAISKPILCDCSACGKEHKGMFYQCTTCVGFTIHSDCAFLPKTLLIQHATNDAFYHTHPLTISYSFPKKDQTAKHSPRCRVCTNRFREENLWIYKCDSCMYYAHVDCATSRGEPFMSIFLPAGSGKTIKNFGDVDHPHLLHLPFPDETYSLPKHLIFDHPHLLHILLPDETYSLPNHLTKSWITDKEYLKHESHKHYLFLVDQTQCNGETSTEVNSSLLMCHNPMKKTQLQCNGCLRPIMSTMPFYKCDDNCGFTLHEWCSRLPQVIKNHPGHPQHGLFLMFPDDRWEFLFGIFCCAVCLLPCNGFAYHCWKCDYYVDVCCGFMPKQITHKAHPNHLLSSRVQERYFSEPCHICLQPLSWDPFTFPTHVPNLKEKLSYNCNMCDIYIHPECALLIPETTMHKYDKHPMHLSYLPIENHKSEYFCEICEEELDPHASFYHCQDCVQSVHSACAPLILRCETNTYTWNERSIYYYTNIKFGGNYNIDGHPHPLSFVQGIMSDVCTYCHKQLQCQMIFKCLECEFALDYECCWYLKFHLFDL